MSTLIQSFTLLASSLHLTTTLSNPRQGIEFLSKKVLRPEPISKLSFKNLLIRLLSEQKKPRITKIILQKRTINLEARLIHKNRPSEIETEQFTNENPLSITKIGISMNSKLSLKT